MQDGKFKSLIIDAYNKSRNGHLNGIIYSPNSSIGLTNIEKKFFEPVINGIEPDMLYLRSNLTNTEIEIYEHQLENYIISDNEHTVYVKLIGKDEIALIY